MSSAPVTFPPRLFIVNRVIWLYLGFICLADAVGLKALGLPIKSVEQPPFATLAIHSMALFLCIFLALCHAYIKRNDIVFFFGNTFGQLITVGWVLGVFVHLCVRTNLPLYDESLISIDHIFGFDWLTFIHWLDKQPQWLNDILTDSYFSIFPQGITIIFVCAATARCANAQRFNIVCVVSCSLCIVLATIFPAVTGFLHYHMDLSNFQHVQTAYTHTYEETYTGLRNHTVNYIGLPLIGIVAFPSFHSASAITLIYASLPFHRLRLLLIPLNGLMLISTLSTGGHYLSDLLGGVAIGLCGIWVAERALPSSQYR